MEKRKLNGLTIGYYVLSVITMFITGCTKEDKELRVSNKSICLYAGETEKIEIESGEDVFFSIGNSYYASVDRSGLVTAKRVGKTNVQVSNAYGAVDVPVEVAAKYSFKSIDFENYIGCTKSKIIEDFGSGNTSSGTGIVYSEYSLTFETKDNGRVKSERDKDCYLAFTFDNNGICNNVGIIMPLRHTTWMGEYLAERYKYGYILDGAFVSINESESITHCVKAYNLSYILYAIIKVK